MKDGQPVAPILSVRRCLLNDLPELLVQERVLQRLAALMDQLAGWPSFSKQNRCSSVSSAMDP